MLTVIQISRLAHLSSRLKHPLRDMMWVALAGPATNLLLAIAFAVLYKSSIIFWRRGLLCHSM